MPAPVASCSCTAEAGGGKSTLLEQVEARLPDATWHWGACDGLFTPLPLAPLRDIAESIGGPLLAASRADASRETLFAALLEAVRADPGLTVLAVEDVQWADEATLDLLRFLGRRIQKERALLLVTFREEDVRRRPATLRKALGELARQRATRRVALAPLSLMPSRRSSAGTGLDPAEVHHLTGGNPYFVAEVVGSADGGLPASARDAVLARAAHLDSTSPRAPRRRGPGRQPRRPGAARGGHRRARGGLRHPRRRRAARHRRSLAAGSGTRSPACRSRMPCPSHGARTLHRAPPRRTAASATSGDDSRLAFHAAGAGDTAAVVQHSRAAARRAAALGAHTARRSSTSTGRWPAGDRDSASTPRSRAEVLDDLSTELGLVDRWEEAEHWRAEAVGLWQALGDPLREGDSLRMRARALSRLARAAEARQAVDQALACSSPSGRRPRSRGPWSTSRRCCGTKGPTPRRSRRATGPRRWRSSWTCPMCSATCSTPGPAR